MLGLFQAHDRLRVSQKHVHTPLPNFLEVQNPICVLMVLGHRVVVVRGCRV